MIQVKNLSFAYKKGAPVFSGINLDILPGNIYGLLGENGVGKTTLLRLISGLLFPKDGNCIAFGEESRHRTPRLLSNIYYLPEDVVVPSVKVLDYGKMYGAFYPNYNPDIFIANLQKFNVTTQKKLTELSHGQQKKAMVAFALACNTSILLMDEPTNGLDIPSKTIFRRMIAESIDETKTFIISTHQVRDLENLIDPIIILEHNQVLLNNSVEEITGKLKFAIKSNTDSSVLYSEPALGGVAVVALNNDGEPSKLNIEMLFNAAISNKETFKNLFINHSK